MSIVIKRIYADVDDDPYLICQTLAAVCRKTATLCPSPNFLTRESAEHKYKHMDRPRHNSIYRTNRHR